MRTWDQKHVIRNMFDDWNEVELPISNYNTYNSLGKKHTMAIDNQKDFVFFFSTVWENLVITENIISKNYWKYYFYINMQTIQYGEIRILSKINK